MGIFRNIGMKMMINELGENKLVRKIDDRNQRDNRYDGKYSIDFYEMVKQITLGDHESRKDNHKETWGSGPKVP